jgi:hypothetical protein
MGTRFIVKKLRNARSRYGNVSEDDSDSREDDSRNDDDSRSEGDDRRDDDDRFEDDDSSQDDDSRPPYSPSPRPRGGRVMGMFDGWRKAFQNS